MGNHSIKSSKENFSGTTKNKSLLCGLCTSSLSIDEKCDRISSTNGRHPKQTKTDLKRSSDDNVSIDSIIESNREFADLIKKFQLILYLKDYLNRLKNSQVNQNFNGHFSSSTIIYPCNGLNQQLTDDLHLFLITPPESILANPTYSSKIHEQIRAKCYFVPLTNGQIEPDDEEYRQRTLPIDRTHVVITLENKSPRNVNQISLELTNSCVLISNDSFQTGSIRIDQETMPKEFLPFTRPSSEDHRAYLSACSMQKWFQTLILVNQTCAIAKRFLMGDKNHISCLLREQENRFSSSNNLIFAALRLPPCVHLQTSSYEEKSGTIIDGFSPHLLSDNEKLSNDRIHLDYEEYSFALILSRWPKLLIENYHTHPQRYSSRQWPSKDQMKIIIRKSLLLIPDYPTDQWKLNFDLIEDYLFQLMNEGSLFFYILCQQFFTQTCSSRRLLKHGFLNYCEKYGLPLTKNKNHLADLIRHFLKDLSKQINQKFLPDYFNHQRNLLQFTEDENQWFAYIHQCLKDRIYVSPPLTITSNRSIGMEFLFDFTEQLFQTFRRKQPEFYLNDSILLDLHRTLANHDILIDNQTMENIQRSLTTDFESNAELVHICLNQIRKSQTSLIFHYTWTIFIQYLHTYSNVLWNL